MKNGFYRAAESIFVILGDGSNIFIFAEFTESEFN